MPSLPPPMSNWVGPKGTLQEQLLLVLMAAAIPIAAKETAASMQVEHNSSHQAYAALLTGHAAIQELLQLIIFNSPSGVKLGILCSQVGCGSPTF